MTKKILSTYERIIQGLNAKERKEFEKEYYHLLLSELYLAFTKENTIKVKTKSFQKYIEKRLTKEEITEIEKQVEREVKVLAQSKKSIKNIQRTYCFD